jgi:hypothetical protein
LILGGPSESSSMSAIFAVMSAKLNWRKKQVQLVSAKKNNSLTTKIDVKEKEKKK